MLWLVILAALPSVEERDAASQEGARLDAEYQRGLAAMMASRNPYARAEALDRFLRTPELVPAESIPRVVEALGDTEPLPPGRCLELLRRDAKEPLMGQGEIYKAAECRHYLSKSNHQRARALLPRLADRPETGALLFRRAYQHPKELEELAALLRELKVMSEPLREQLASGEVDATALRLALELPCGFGSSYAASVARGMASADERVRLRAAMVVLLLAGRCSDSVKGDARLREEAGRTLAAALPTAPPHAFAELGRIGAAAQPLLPKLRELLSTRPGQALLALEGLGPAAAPLEREVSAVLRDPRRAASWPAAVQVLARIGPSARSGKAALLAHFGRRPEDLDQVAAALSAIGATLSAAELAPLERLYRKRCADAGSIPFFSLSRDDDCAALAGALREVARRSGLRFREVGWAG